MSTAPSVHDTLTFEEVALVRTALRERLDRFKLMLHNPSLRESYEQMRELLNGKLHQKHWTKIDIVPPEQ